MGPCPAAAAVEPARLPIAVWRQMPDVPAGPAADSDGLVPHHHKVALIAPGRPFSDAVPLTQDEIGQLIEAHASSGGQTALHERPETAACCTSPSPG
jgi:hypothetical protein